VRFELWDSPGAGEAGWNSLRDKLHATLREADVVLYLVDGSKLGNALDEDYLGVLADAVDPVLIRKFNNRLFFLINKFTETARNDKPIGSVQQDLSAKLSKIFQERYGQRQDQQAWIQPESLLPLNALYAYYARSWERGTIGPDYDNYLADIER
jgi:predicted GTPase